MQQCVCLCVQKEQSGRCNEKISIEQAPHMFVLHYSYGRLSFRIGRFDLMSISVGLSIYQCITSCQPSTVISQLRNVCSYYTCESFCKSDGDANSYGNLLVDLLESIFCLSLLCVKNTRKFCVLHVYLYRNKKMNK